MSKPLFIMGVWITIISLEAATLLSGVFGMGTYEAREWSLRLLHNLQAQDIEALITLPDL